MCVHVYKHMRMWHDLWVTASFLHICLLEHMWYFDRKLITCSLFMTDHSTAAEPWRMFLGLTRVCMPKRGHVLYATRKIQSWLYFWKLSQTSDRTLLALHAHCMEPRQPVTVSDVLSDFHSGCVQCSFAVVLCREKLERTKVYNGRPISIELLLHKCLTRAMYTEWSCVI